MTELAIIGGTGLTSLPGLSIDGREDVATPFGKPSAALIRGHFHARPVLFLPRHGVAGNIPPHQVNYRANVWALREVGTRQIIAVNAVGGIQADLVPGTLLIPDQLIDYTHSRRNTFFEDELEHVVHVDFTEPYCPTLREVLIAAAREAGLAAVERGTYGVTQGPRLETSAEVDRLERDGCQVVGMTGMPEAVLARELDLCYAACVVVANAAAGRGAGAISMAEIEFNLESGMERVRALLVEVLKRGM
ncbi:MAG: S-methyl-5'-thioinosine phosphorylase [Gammaproteobacteria bacterium]|nr:S-methyl-5'-thioinosine phosphorylase [Gammaproteobacteria bacterium]MDJ0873322.1 S-methyl-5'-thioinosine phosphorylase [Gammaproteobacteria bacterium]